MPGYMLIHAILNFMTLGGGGGGGGGVSLLLSLNWIWLDFW